MVVTYSSDWFLGWEKRFYSIRVFGDGLTGYGGEGEEKGEKGEEEDYFKYNEHLLK